MTLWKNNIYCPFLLKMEQKNNVDCQRHVALISKTTNDIQKVGRFLSNEKDNSTYVVCCFKGDRELGGNTTSTKITSFSFLIINFK